MKIIVCLKQVPDAANVKLSPNDAGLPKDKYEKIVNPFDLFAIEAALKFRDQIESVTIKAITMGPPETEYALKEALAFGADEAILLSDPAFAGADTWATSLVLAMAIKKETPDLIICGKQAVDGDTGQVGPGIAGILSLPSVAFVKGWETITEKSIVFHRQTDDGYDVVEMPLPGLITVVREVGDPRPQSLKRKLKAQKYKPIVWGPADLGLKPEQVGEKGSFTQIKRIFAPATGGQREMITGTPEEAGRILIDRLIENKTIPMMNGCS